MIGWGDGVTGGHLLVVAYEFEVLGWEDWDGNVYDQPPLDTDLPDVAGTFSMFWDPETGDSHAHWVYSDEVVRDWDDWWDMIEGSMEDYGYSPA
jgi:hypothetical protein